MDLPLIHTLFVPKGKLDAIVVSKLVVDVPQVVLDDLAADSKLLGDFAVLQSLGHQFHDAQLSVAWRSEGRLYRQKTPKLAGRYPHFFRIFFVVDQSKKLANTLFLFGKARSCHANGSTATVPIDRHRWRATQSTRAAPNPDLLGRAEIQGTLHL
jgi:hypothetical protein